MTGQEALAFVDEIIKMYNFPLAKEERPKRILIADSNEAYISYGNYFYKDAWMFVCKRVLFPLDSQILVAQFNPTQSQLPSPNSEDTLRMNSWIDFEVYWASREGIAAAVLSTYWKGLLGDNFAFVDYSAARKDAFLRCILCNMDIYICEGDRLVPPKEFWDKLNKCIWKIEWLYEL